MPILYSLALSGSLGFHDVNFPCERVAQGNAAVVEENLEMSLASYPALSLRFDSLLELMPNSNLQAPHAPTWAAWGVSLRHENQSGGFIEVAHWSGHGIPGLSLFREEQWSAVKIGIRFGRPLPSVPVQTR